MNKNDELSPSLCCSRTGSDRHNAGYRPVHTWKEYMSVVKGVVGAAFPWTPSNKLIWIDSEKVLCDL